MKKVLTTKENIRLTTLQLLNERGLSNVKMRDVSDSLSISIGNLTYHYAKWENLIDDIFMMFKNELEDHYTHFPKDIREVVNYIDRIYRIQMKYSFLFSNFYIFFQQFPKYKTEENNFFHDRMFVMRKALDILIHKGYLYPANCEHNYDLIVKNTWLILSGWYGFSMIFKDTDNAITKEEFFLSIWNMYVYHLTDEGKMIVKKSFEDLKKSGTF